MARRMLCVIHHVAYVEILIPRSGSKSSAALGTGGGGARWVCDGCVTGVRRVCDESDGV